MRICELPKWRLLAIAALCVLSVSGYAARDDDEDDDEMDEVTAEELLIEDLPVDERIFLTEWNKVPYDSRYFTYSDEQIKEKWEYLMRGLRIPYPSAAFMKKQFKKYPFLADDIEGFTPPFSDADYARLEKVYLDVWRNFFAGDFQAAREKGLKTGPLGVIPALFSQVLYASYLTERQSVKYMLLQDVANNAKKYFKIMEPAESDPEAQALVAAARRGYAYAIGRIAEESPVPVAIARRYIGKVKNNSDFIIEIMPDHPLGLAFRAGVDAGIMRRVGKFTGRMTYGARTTTVEESFAKAMELAPDIPIVAYEYGNALIYMNRKRSLNKAMKYLESATKMRPQFSMDALDTMYAYKRLQEVKLYALNYRSFRKFEKARRKFSKATDRNLTSVLTPSLTMDMLENPDKYILEEY